MPPPRVEWTPERAADPELVHLHLQAAAVTGAFVVPWLEGVTLRPCSIVVRVQDEVVQSARFTYDEDGRLLSVAVDGHVDSLERDVLGRLERARGYEYGYDKDNRLESIAEPSDSGDVTHALTYSGTLLVGIHSEGRGTTRDHVLTYGANALMSQRAWSDSSGAHGESYYTYDEAERLVRVDIESTNASGEHRRQPSMLIEYDGDRLVEFGRSVIEYDTNTRVHAVTTEQGARAEYGYDCP